MKERINAGYKIIRTISFGEFEYVLGENQKCEFVTWRYTHGTYYFGHYITDYNKALIDLYTRVLAETQAILENIKESTNEK